MRAVLKYELSPVPLAIAHFNGEMRETCKSSLLKELEFDTEAAVNIQTVQSDYAYIIDLMAVVQSTSKRKLKTFDELSHSLSNCIVAALPYADHVYIVPDRYDKYTSIKSFERTRRGVSMPAERFIE